MSEGIQYYILDTETTGLKVGYQEITEISIIRCSDRLQLTRQLKALRPKNASVDALRITGKTMNDLYHGVSQTEAADAVDTFFKQDGLTSAHRCVVAHNTAFDRKFLHQMWEELERGWQADLWLDTIPFSKRLAAQMGQPKAKVKLEAAMELFGLKKQAGLHTAKGDTRNTYYLWQHLMAQNIEYIDLIKQFPHRKVEEINDEDVENLMAE